MGETKAQDILEADGCFERLEALADDLDIIDVKQKSQNLLRLYFRELETESFDDFCDEDDDDDEIDRFYNEA